MNETHVNLLTTGYVTRLLLPYVERSDWVSDMLLDIKQTLLDDKLPPANEAYDLNPYYYERLKVETELEADGASFAR